MDDTPLMAVVRPLLIKHEGWRTVAYDDATGKAVKPGIPIKGNVTAAVGFNLDQPCARPLCAQMGIDYDALHSGTLTLTPEQIDAILNHFVIETVEWLTKLFPDFESYSVNRRAALVDMGFNLGPHHFMNRHEMIGAILSGLWGTASDHALHDFHYDKQVGRRAYDDAELMISG